MTTGFDIVIPFAGDPDPSLQYASLIDMRLNPGALWLAEPTHSSAPWVAGVPTNDGAKRPNVASASAIALIGSGDTSTMQGDIGVGGYGSPRMVGERTAKGALHIATSATARGGAIYGVRVPAAVLNFTAAPANRGRAQALFVWYYVSRAAPNVSNLFDVMIGGNASNYLFREQLENTVGLHRASFLAPSGWTGTPGNYYGGIWAGNSAQYSGLNDANGKSIILYSATMIDVAASGASFDQLDQNDESAFIEAFNPGGRFNGDSWTAPATLLAA